MVTGKLILLMIPIVYMLFQSISINYGTDEDNIRIGLWDYYKRDKAVSIIIGNADDL